LNYGIKRDSRGVDDSGKPVVIDGIDEEALAPEKMAVL